MIMMIMMIYFRYSHGHFDDHVERLSIDNAQDSHGRSSSDINKLGDYSEESNQSRNFWNFMKLPLDRVVGKKGYKLDLHILLPKMPIITAKLF